MMTTCLEQMPQGRNNALPTRNSTGPPSLKPVCFKHSSKYTFIVHFKMEKANIENDPAARCVFILYTGRQKNILALYFRWKCTVFTNMRCTVWYCRTLPVFLDSWPGTQKSSGETHCAFVKLSSSQVYFYGTWKVKNCVYLSSLLETFVVVEQVHFCQFQQRISCGSLSLFRETKWKTLRKRSCAWIFSPMEIEHFGNKVNSGPFKSAFWLFTKFQLNWSFWSEKLFVETARRFPNNP